MTLADLIRKYLEDRRKACEQKARYLDLSSDNFQFYTDHNPDDNVISLSNNQFFSNNLDPKSNDRSRSSNSKTYKKSIGVSRSSRITTLPDGTIQVETIIRDSEGNEKKYLTLQKDGKKHTTLIRKTPSGEEVVEQNGEDFESEISSINRFNFHPFSRPSKPNSDNDYDFWYNKFFKSGENKKMDERSDNIMTYDPHANMDEQIEKILKEFGFNGVFRPPAGNKGSDDTTDFDKGTFTAFGDSTINEEMRKMFENFGGLDFNTEDGQMKRKSTHNHDRHLDKMFKGLVQKPPSMFEQFAEDAYVELPEENTPLDKFVEPDKERLNKLEPMLRKSREMLEKLEKYFTPKANAGGDIYSDIEDSKDSDLALVMPQIQQEFPPNVQNFGDVLRRVFEPDEFIKSANIQTQMYFGNGRKKTESIRKDPDGNTVKNIMYEIGDQKYNVKITTNRFGVEVNREKSQNFPKRDLTKFKKQWGPEFATDFMDD